VTYRGKVKDGTIVLEPGVELPEGAAVRIELEPKGTATGRQVSDPLLEMTKLAVETNIRDLATNIDRYLYGHPKESIFSVPFHDGGALLKPWTREELMDEMNDP
jgi:hypothetical protein